MASTIKGIYNLKGILFLMLLTIPSEATTNLDCHGKPFHCVNSTHFMICVDLGSGISTTIDDFVIPCPSITACRPTNRYECEFPAPSASEVYEASTLATTFTTVSDVTTFKPPVTNAVHLEDYINTISYTALPEVELQLTTTESIPSVKPTAAVHDFISASKYDILVTDDSISRDAGQTLDTVIINSPVSTILPSDSISSLNVIRNEVAPVNNEQELLTTTEKFETRVTDSLLINHNYSNIENVTLADIIGTATTEQIITTSKNVTTVFQEPLVNLVIPDNQPVTSTAMKPIIEPKYIDKESESEINVLVDEFGSFSNSSVNTGNIKNISKNEADYSNIMNITEATIENNKSVVANEATPLIETESPVINSDRYYFDNITSPNVATMETIVDEFASTFQPSLINTTNSDSLVLGNLTTEGYVIEEEILQPKILQNSTTDKTIAVEKTDDQVIVFTANSVRANGFENSRKENSLNSILYNVTTGTKYDLKNEASIHVDTTITPPDTMEFIKPSGSSKTENNNLNTATNIYTRIDIDGFAGTYQPSLTNNNTNSDSLVTDDFTTKGQVIEVATLQPNILQNSTIGTTIAVASIDDQVSDFTANSVNANEFESSREENNLNAISYNVTTGTHYKWKNETTIHVNTTFTPQVTKEFIKPSGSSITENNNQNTATNINTRIDVYEFASTYQTSLTNTTNNDSLVTDDLKKEGQTIETTLQPEIILNSTISTTMAVESIEDQLSDFTGNSVNANGFESTKIENNLNAISYDVTTGINNDLKNEASIHVDTTIEPPVAKEFIKPSESSATENSNLNIATNIYTNTDVVTINNYHNNLETITDTSTTQDVESPTDVFTYSLNDTENIGFDLNLVNTTKTLPTTSPDVTTAPEFNDNKILSDKENIAQSESVTLSSSPALSSIHVEITDSSTTDIMNEINANNVISPNAGDVTYKKLHDVTNKPAGAISTGTTIQFDPNQIVAKTEKNPSSLPAATVGPNKMSPTKYSEVLPPTNAVKVETLPSVPSNNVKLTQASYIPIYSPVETTESLISHSSYATHDDENAHLDFSTSAMPPDTTYSTKHYSILETSGFNSFKVNENTITTDSTNKLRDSYVSDYMESQNQITSRLPSNDARTSEENTLTVDGFSKHNDRAGDFNITPASIISSTDYLNKPALPIDQPSVTENLLNVSNYRIGENFYRVTSTQDHINAYSVNTDLVQTTQYSTDQSPDSNAGATQKFHAEGPIETTSTDNKYNGIMTLQITTTPHSDNIQQVYTSTSYTELFSNASFIAESPTTDSNLSTYEIKYSPNLFNDKGTRIESEFNRMTPIFYNESIAQVDLNTQLVEGQGIAENVILNAIVGQSVLQTNESVFLKSIVVNQTTSSDIVNKNNNFTDDQHLQPLVQENYDVSTISTDDGIIVTETSHTLLVDTKSEQQEGNNVINLQLTHTNSNLDIISNANEKQKMNATTAVSKNDVSSPTIVTSTPYLSLLEQVTYTTQKTPPNNREVLITEQYGKQLMPHTDGISIPSYHSITSQFVTESIENQLPTRITGTAKTFEKPYQRTQNNATSEIAKASQSILATENHITDKTILENSDIPPIQRESETSIVTQTVTETIVTVLDASYQTRSTTLSGDLYKDDIANTPITPTSRINAEMETFNTKQRELPKRPEDSFVGFVSIIEPALENVQKHITKTEDITVVVKNVNEEIEIITASTSSTKNEEQTSSIAIVTNVASTETPKGSDVVVDKNIETEKTHSGIISLIRKASNKNENVEEESKGQQKPAIPTDTLRETPQIKESEPDKISEILKIDSFSYPSNSFTSSNTNISSKKEELPIKTENNNFQTYGDNKAESSTLKFKTFNNIDSSTITTVSENNKKAPTLEPIEYNTNSTNDTYTSNTKSKDQNNNTSYVHSTTVISKDQSSTPRYVSQTKLTAMGNGQTEFPAYESTSSKPGTNNFTCKQKIRGRYADELDCRKFYICLGNSPVVEGTCPINTVFSEISKQCTKNLSLCIRNNQFRCVTEGRFSDFLIDNIYYICVKNNISAFIRFKLQCQNGYRLNKTSVRCVLNKEYNESTSKSDGSKNNSDQSESSAITEQKKKTGKLFKCNKEGIFADPTDCKRYFECTKIEKRVYKQKRKKCDSEEVFHKDKKKCVDDESYECN